MRLAIISLALLVLSSCQTKRVVIIREEPYKLAPPPGMTQIGSNRFIDVVEVQNSDYLSYVFWYFYRHQTNNDPIFYEYFNDPNCYSLEATYFTEDSIIYSNNSCVEQYWSHPGLLYAPLMGIDFNNAQGYTKWRQDRILEHLLLEAKLIARTSIIEHPITLEEFLNGEVKLNPTNLKWITIPVLSLPEKKDIVIALSDTIQEYFVPRRKTTKKYSCKLSKAPFFLDDCQELITFNYLPKPPVNRYGVFHLEDGVKEFISPTIKREIEQNRVLTYRAGEFTPSNGLGNRQTGFRCVGKYILVRLPLNR